MYTHSLFLSLSLPLSPSLSLSLSPSLSLCQVPLLMNLILNTLVCHNLILSGKGFYKK